MRKINGKLTVVIALMVLACGAVFSVAIMALRMSFYEESRRVEEFVLEIDEYRKNHGIYPPNDGAVVPRSEFDNPYFYEVSEDEYVVGFSIGFDETYYYSSRKGDWSRGAPIPLMPRSPSGAPFARPAGE